MLFNLSHFGQCLIFRTKEDELEEIQLREELKAIDAALRKNKKVSFCSAKN
jgi:hypothetical protein